VQEAREGEGREEEGERGGKDEGKGGKGRCPCE
jgi:hypothetical protein